MYLIVKFVDIATHKQIIFLFLTCSLDETTKQFFSYFVFTLFYKMWLCLLWFIQSYFCVYVCHLLTPFLLKAVCITFKRDVPIWVENQTFILCSYQKTIMIWLLINYTWKVLNANCLSMVWYHNKMMYNRVLIIWECFALTV